MYWIHGAPSIFAAKEHEPQPSISDDGADTRAHGHLVDEKQDSTAFPRASNGTVITGHDGIDTREEAGRHHSEPRPQRLNGGVESEREIVQAGNRDPEALVPGKDDSIVGLRVSRNGDMFVTITRSTLTIWQTRPTVAVASVVRSPHSLRTYGPNACVLLRPDSVILVIQTTQGYLITYSLATDPGARIYKHAFPDNTRGHSRHKSFGGRVQRGEEDIAGPGERGGVREVSVRFRMVIKVDAGISKALAQDDELVVATIRPAAIQCIRWSPDKAGSQTSTELLKSMAWLSGEVSIVEIVYDRPMNLACWATSDGKAYAVQRVTPEQADSGTNGSSKLFRGFGFHLSLNDGSFATKVAICARFSLLAVGCANGTIHIYAAKDYVGHIPLSHTLSPPVSATVSGHITFLSYSPDGYCLFAGYSKGWASWSVYGKPGANSFTTDRPIAKLNGEGWLLGLKNGFWVGNGSQLLVLSANDNRLWMLDVARSAVAGCYSSANIARSLLQTSTGFMIYRGYDLPDLNAISAEHVLWHHVQVPSSYLAAHWPIRSAVTSPDGKYVAIAGRRGLAHYGVHSGRWKTFDDPVAESDFTVRGGMCWHQHVLIAAVETIETYEIRIYSRDAPMDSNIRHVEQLPSPIVLLSPSGEDSLLVYTYDNQLYHYIISATDSAVKLVQVGQIGLHGIIRAPARVRALSWILPEDQLDNGDPTQDVALATVVFLVDGKLVLLQPSMKISGELKYDMRIIGSNVEYYILMRDQQQFRLPSPHLSDMPSLAPDPRVNGLTLNDLRDSLWYFDGVSMGVWTDIQDVLASSSPAEDVSREMPPPIRIPVDFYPLSVLLNKGTLFGVEAEMVQRRDISFTFLRFMTRTHLFLPPILRHHLSQYNQPSALYLSHYYQHLPYFPHALEVLLHDILDEEVDSPPDTPESALLPSVLSFLSSFPHFLDIIVQCTRKTEVRSWRTLFRHLPPPRDLFESALRDGRLKTAGGYLLILNTLEEDGLSSPRTTSSSARPLPGSVADREREDQVGRLLRLAREDGDYELCKELARFLTALDPSGRLLRETLDQVGLLESQRIGALAIDNTRAVPTLSNGVGLGIRRSSSRGGPSDAGSLRSADRGVGQMAFPDYFGARGDTNIA